MSQSGLTSSVNPAYSSNTPLLFLVSLAVLTSGSDKSPYHILLLIAWLYSAMQQLSTPSHAKILSLDDGLALCLLHAQLRSSGLSTYHPALSSTSPIPRTRIHHPRSDLFRTSPAPSFLGTESFQSTTASTFWTTCAPEGRRASWSSLSGRYPTGWKWPYKMWQTHADQSRFTSLNRPEQLSVWTTNTLPLTHAALLASVQSGACTEMSATRAAISCASKDLAPSVPGLTIMRLRGSAMSTWMTTMCGVALLDVLSRLVTPANHAVNAATSGGKMLSTTMAQLTHTSKTLLSMCATSRTRQNAAIMTLNSHTAWRTSIPSRARQNCLGQGEDTPFCPSQPVSQVLMRRTATNSCSPA
jgi:hypothetical protein